MNAAQLLWFCLLIQQTTFVVVQAMCPKKCSCKNISENIQTLRVRCDDQHIVNWQELNFGDDVHIIASINASKNAIAQITEEDFKSFTDLKRLDLSSNLLSELDKDTFGTSLLNVERLKLANNSISHIYEGTFEHMPKLRQLDLSNNPLACDCGLIWLIAWSNARDIRLLPAPKCDSPINFRGMPLKKLKVGIDFRCESLLQPLLELVPKQNQIAFEGDELQLKCFAPRVAIGAPRESEDLPTRAYVFWGWSDKIRQHNSTDDIIYRDPTKVFNDVNLETPRHSTDNGILNSILRIGSLTQNHTGMWDCTLRSQQANLSQSIVLHVVAKGTLYCDAIVTNTNKGSYHWPRTMRGETVLQSCVEEPSDMSLQRKASHECGATGQWLQLNTESCVYVSETTRIFEQFAKVNLTLTKGQNALEIARRLHNFTHIQTQLHKIRDPMDLEYIARTLLKYLEQLEAHQAEISYLLMDIVSQLLTLPKKLFEAAQLELQTGHKLLHIVEAAAMRLANAGEDQVTHHMTQRNIYVDFFDINLEQFLSMSCVWLSNSQRGLQCNSLNDTIPMYEHGDIDAAIQIPYEVLNEQMFVNSTNRNCKLMITLHRNAKLLPQLQTEQNENETLTSVIIGAKLYNSEGTELKEEETQTEPVDERITIMLRAHPYHDDRSAPMPAWWDDQLKIWNPRVCQQHYQHRTLLMFSCSRIGYFGLLQRMDFLNDYKSEKAGAKFRHAPYAIYIGCGLLFASSWFNIVTFVVFNGLIKINRVQRHALINTWLALSTLCLTFVLGIYQTSNLYHCRLFGLMLHYLSLCVLLWLCVSLSSMYKRLSKSIAIPLNVNGNGNGNGTINGTVNGIGTGTEPHQRKPILGIYLVGWGIALLICGISSAVNFNEYAAYNYCFLNNPTTLNALIVPASILLIFSLILTLCIYYQLQQQTVNSLQQQRQYSDNNTQATEHIDLDWLDANGCTNKEASNSAFQLQLQEQYSTLSNPLSSIVDDFERSNMSHLRGHLIFLILYISAWLSAALYIQQQQQLYVISFLISCISLAIFLLLFYNLTRNDARQAWTQQRIHLVAYNNVAAAGAGGATTSNGAGTRATGAAMISNSIVAYKAGPNSIYEANNSTGSRSNSQCSNKQRSSSARSMRSQTRSNGHMDSTTQQLLNGNPNITIINNNAGVGVATAAMGVGVGVGASASLMLNGHEHIPTADIFYNPNQINVARKFFKKQKRLAKRNNFELQRQALPQQQQQQQHSLQHLQHSLSDVSSEQLYSRHHNAMTLLAGGSKVNNTNLHYKSAGIGTSSAVHKDQRSKILQANIYTNIPETLTPQHEVIKLRSSVRTPSLLDETLHEHDDELLTTTQEDEDDGGSSLDEHAPLYANTTPQTELFKERINPIPIVPLVSSTPVPVPVKQPSLEAMNSLGLPAPEEPLLPKHDIYVSNSVQVTNSIRLDDPFSSVHIRFSHHQQQQSKSLNNISDMNDLKSSSNQLVEAGNPLAAATSLTGSCSSSNLPQLLPLNPNPSQRLLAASPTNESDLNYQNSEISIRSHGLYAPQADNNDLNLTLTDDFRCYQSSNASDADVDILNEFDDEFVAYGTTEPLYNHHLAVQGIVGAGEAVADQNVDDDDDEDDEDEEQQKDDPCVLEEDEAMNNSIDELYEAIKCRSPLKTATKSQQQQQQLQLQLPNMEASGLERLRKTDPTIEKNLNETVEDDSSQSSVISYIDPRATTTATTTTTTTATTTNNEHLNSSHSNPS